MILRALRPPPIGAIRAIRGKNNSLKNHPNSPIFSQKVFHKLFTRGLFAAVNNGFLSLFTLFTFLNL